MLVSEMRTYIKDAYPGPTWKRKCDRMPKAQVIAIYRSIIERESKQTAGQPKKPEGRQLTIFEFLRKE